MPDHFYTTDYHGELAPDVGYSLENDAGFVFISQQPGTVPIYRFYNPETSDHFYTQHSEGEMALAAGYQRESVGIGWYMYPDQKDGTEPFYRWWGNNDHFYTTDQNGEGLSGYGFEGKLGYICARQEPGSVPLRRWIKRQSYELNGLTLKTWRYNNSMGRMISSYIHLNHCLRTSTKLEAQSPPESLTDPEDDFLGVHSLSQMYQNQQATLEMRDSGNIFCRHNRQDYTHESTLDIEPYLRRSHDGVIEFVYRNRDKSKDWMYEMVAVMKEAMEEPKSAFEEGLDLAFQMLDKWLNKKEEDHKINPELHEFMSGTYVDGDRLIRRGYSYELPEKPKRLSAKGKGPNGDEVEVSVD